MASPPDFVTTLMTEPADRPSSAEKRFVATWNSCTASCEIFCSGPPTTSSLSSMPSIMMLPPRPAWPADETTTDCALVGSKFGAGALPGVRKASSRKLRPFSGSDSISRAETTEPTTEASDIDGSRVAGDGNPLGHAGDLQHNLDLGRLADLQLNPGHALQRESGGGDRQIDGVGRHAGQREVAGRVRDRLALESGPRLSDRDLCGHAAVLRIEDASSNRRGGRLLRGGRARDQRHQASQGHQGAHRQPCLHQDLQRVPAHAA